MKKISKEKLIFISFLVIGTLFLPDAAKGFMDNNMFEGIKNLLIFMAIGIIGFLYILPNNKDDKK